LACFHRLECFLARVPLGAFFLRKERAIILVLDFEFLGKLLRQFFGFLGVRIVFQTILFLVTDL
jgi:hypothetical protein